ncbi:MAG TPA: protein translocase subunit SecF [Streptosporangiaceae bacterium]
MMSRIGAIGGRLYRGEVSVEFVGRRRLWYSVSAAIVLISLVSLLVRGLNFSVEFQGGAVFTVNGASTASISQVEKAVSDAGVSGAVVQHVGSGSNASWQVQTKQVSPTQSQNVQNSLHSELGAGTNVSVTSVSGTWGAQITSKAVQALIAFLIVIVIYLSVAFEWKMAVAAFVALLHDLLITTGVYSLTGFQVSPASVIGFLTILGYSLYDTVVVFDKVRENTAGLLGGARSTYSQAANLALNQTLVRSINTSLIALLPVAAILFVGGGLLGAGELKDLALVLFVGMLSGTYSSIFIATPVLAQIKEREPQYQALAKRVALRAAGGRSAVKKAAKTAGSGASRTSATAGRRNAGTSILEDDNLAEAVDTDAGVDDVAYDAPEDDEAVTDVPASAAPASRAQSGAGRAYTPGPRQQPRRDGRGNSARRRPAGKKKRR